MANNSYEGVPGRYLSRYTSSSSEDENGIPQNPTPSLNGSRTLHDTSPSNPGPPTLACPVLGCSLVFKGEMPHGYLWRHLKRPGAHGRTGEEKAIWENLHKIEHNRLLAIRVTPAQRRREANKARSRKMLRSAGFEQRARNMGITEKALVAQKVAIWEGIWATKQNGDNIRVSILYPTLF
ncbi:hypothetical protein B9Z19DRAFT_1119436 [Tuber borchii]|uniref:Uncharacterized protein n=1 Tax=Tuber borchii TaxID=42251 RepID=A0A2T7A6L2_TUBBO|nr:hypothetical protein B9Z19DRAFT_1119436 [Tuber borchii]